MRRDSVPRVIVGVDGSLAGLRAVRVAVVEARQRGAVLHAVRAWRLAPLRPGSPADWHRQVECEAMDFIARAFDEAMGGVPDDVEVVMATALGRPGRALVDYAHDDNDLLIVGSGQRSWWRRLFRSSTARYCAPRACCPVLVVPLDAFARAARREGISRAVRRDLTILSR